MISPTPLAALIQETTHWVHNLDPIAVHIYGNIAIRWYGIAYVLGFVVALWLLRIYYRKGISPLTPEQQSSFMFYMILGVLIGGRVGHTLLYSLDSFLHDPLTLFKVWEGGMASHGGFVGVIVAVWLFGRRHNISFFRLGDIVVSLTPPGLFLGRMANFINGELWGKVTDVSWAVIFPASARPGTPLEMIPPRHPSQLYEAALEGLLLLVYTQWRIWRTDVTGKPGSLGGEFLVGYALVRIFGEQFREPDAALIFGMSRGIFYSIFLVAMGIALIWYARRKSSETSA